MDQFSPLSLLLKLKEDYLLNMAIFSLIYGKNFSFSVNNERFKFYSTGPSSRGKTLKKLFSRKFVKKKLISLSRQRWLHGIDIGSVVCGHPSQSVNRGLMLGCLFRR